MQERNTLKTLAALALAGTLFAGYLSGVTLFTESCAFNEPCPYVLGYPACWYGLAMFGALTAASFLALLGRMAVRTAMQAMAVIAGGGILFAGWLTWNELAPGLKTYGLGLPTCAYGLIFYVIIFAVALRALRKPPSVRPQ